ncbi:hypothetical protein [Streptomyces sp. NPDC002962]|uniref:hypothetical protein n=1 Tax=Streptomyces sp. NPDC002962 TaxID=3364674 RepID=UPI003689D26C
MSTLPTSLPAFLGACTPAAASPGQSAVLAALRAVYEIGHHGPYVWCVGRMKTALSRARARRRLEQVSGGVLLLLGPRMALDGRPGPVARPKPASTGSRDPRGTGRMLPVAITSASTRPSHVSRHVLSGRPG